MKWLRMKPEDVKELDESRRYHAVDVEDEELEHGEEEGGAEDEQEQPQSVDRRKKAPMRRRRMGSKASDAGANGVSTAAG